MKSPITHEHHLELAKHLRTALAELRIVCSAVQAATPQNSKAWRLAEKLNPSSLGGLFSEFRSELDNLYHSVTTDEQFQAEGHVYYRPRKDHTHA